MRIDRQERRKSLALLLAALMLLSNAVVTAHAFGESQHPAQDECGLLHQFERQMDAPAGLPAPSLLQREFIVTPTTESSVAPAFTRCSYLSRAPPFA